MLKVSHSYKSKTRLFVLRWWLDIEVSRVQPMILSCNETGRYGGALNK